MMKNLLDGDVLLYEVGFGSQWTDEEGELIFNSFDRVVNLLEDKLREIREATDGDDDPIFYLTGNPHILKRENRLRKIRGEEPLEYVTPFREVVAVTQKYKDRPSSKPYHYTNLISYIMANYNYKIAWGLEADDLLSIDHRLDPDNTIICTRDKDLRITPGNHYGWSVGNQPEFGPMYIDKLGFLEYKGGKLKGGGLRFFYSQLITGDAVDTIPGLKGKGPAFAYKLLKDCEDEEALFRATSSVYRDIHGDRWRDYMLEQGNLLWMIQEVDDNGTPVYFTLPGY